MRMTAIFSMSIFIFLLAESPSGAARRSRIAVPSGPRNRFPGLHSLTYGKRTQSGIVARNMASRLGMRFLHTQKGRVSPASLSPSRSLDSPGRCGEIKPCRSFDPHPPGVLTAKRIKSPKVFVIRSVSHVHFFRDSGNRCRLQPMPFHAPTIPLPAARKALSASRSQPSAPARWRGG